MKYFCAVKGESHFLIHLIDTLDEAIKYRDDAAAQWGDSPMVIYEAQPVTEDQIISANLHHAAC